MAAARRLAARRVASSGLERSVANVLSELNYSRRGVILDNDARRVLEALPALEALQIIAEVRELDPSLMRPSDFVKERAISLSPMSPLRPPAKPPLSPALDASLLRRTSIGSHSSQSASASTRSASSSSLLPRPRVYELEACSDLESDVEPTARNVYEPAIKPKVKLNTIARPRNNTSGQVRARPTVGIDGAAFELMEDSNETPTSPQKANAAESSSDCSLASSQSDNIETLNSRSRNIKGNGQGQPIPGNDMIRRRRMPAEAKEPLYSVKRQRPQRLATKRCKTDCQDHGAKPIHRAGTPPAHQRASYRGRARPAAGIDAATSRLTEHQQEDMLATPRMLSWSDDLQSFSLADLKRLAILEGMTPAEVHQADEDVNPFKVLIQAILEIRRPISTPQERDSNIDLHERKLKRFLAGRQPPKPVSGKVECGARENKKLHSASTKGKHIKTCNSIRGYVRESRESLMKCTDATPVRRDVYETQASSDLESEAESEAACLHARVATSPGAYEVINIVDDVLDNKENEEVEERSANEDVGERLTSDEAEERLPLFATEMLQRGDSISPQPSWHEDMNEDDACDQGTCEEAEDVDEPSGSCAARPVMYEVEDDSDGSAQIDMNSEDLKDVDDEQFVFAPPSSAVVEAEAAPRKIVFVPASPSLGEEVAEVVAEAVAEEKISAERLKDVYGYGLEVMLKRGYVVGDPLGKGAITTCLRGSRRFSAGRGLGFSPQRSGQQLDVWRSKVYPPPCTFCKKRRWPAWRSGKGRWHCGYCRRPEGGRPRCHRCSAVTWNGWNGPKAHGFEWWCSQCWCTDQEQGSEAWEAWFKYRQERFPDEFVGGQGPEILPSPSKKDRRRLEREAVAGQRRMPRSRLVSKASAALQEGKAAQKKARSTQRHTATMKAQPKKMPRCTKTVTKKAQPKKMPRYTKTVPVLPSRP